MTCVYTNRYDPPIPPPTKGTLTIRKVTGGGVAGFSYAVTPAGGHDKPTVVRATTIQPGVPVDAQPSPQVLAPGAYTIRERPTASMSGRWHLVGVHCNGSRGSTTAPVNVTIHVGEATVCTFANVFEPAGSISLSKITRGATGTANFLITSRASPPAQYRQHATTTTSDAAADATPVSDADATGHLRLGTYTITEEAPPSASANGWTLISAVCNGMAEPFSQGTVQVALTPDHPRVHCVYTDAFSAQPTPSPPPLPPTLPPTTNRPAPGGNSAGPAYALSDLVVHKHASTATVTRGGTVTYRITVKNLGPDAAQRVVLADRPAGDAIVLSIHNPACACQARFPIDCRLGTIKAGATVTVTVQLSVDTTDSSLTNRAVAGTATNERTLTNNVSQATVKMVAPPPPSSQPPPGLG